MSFRAKIRGAKETQKEMERIARELQGPPMVTGMRDATLLVEGDAKRNLVGYQSPEVGGVDTGRLRASIVPQVQTRGSETIGIVGSNVKYSAYVELGTRPHWPPIQAIQGWVERQSRGGFAAVRRESTYSRDVVRSAQERYITETAYLVARAISRRGTQGKHYLQRAFDANKERIKELIGNVVGRIINR